LTACFKLMKTLQPDQRRRTKDALCDTCVYHSMNLDRTLYDGKGIGDLPEESCALEFVPGDDCCDEMRTSNCSIRKSR
jgi:hypothetical protein